MQHNDLEQLLRQADRAANIPVTSPAELAHRVRSRARRQKRTRIALGCGAGTALILLSIGSTMTSWNKPKAHSPAIAVTTQPTVPLEDLSRQIRELCAEADRIALIAKQLRSATLASRTAAPNPPTQASRNRDNPVAIPTRFVIEQEAEITARVMVDQAARWLTRPERRDEGIRTYHRTIDLFPTTTAAKTALLRLTQLEKQSGATT